MKTASQQKNVFYFLTLLLVSLVAGSVRVSFTGFTGKVGHDDLEETAGGKTASIVVLLEDQADLYLWRRDGAGVVTHGR